MRHPLFSSPLDFAIEWGIVIFQHNSVTGPDWPVRASPRAYFLPPSDTRTLALSVGVGIYAKS